MSRDFWVAFERFAVISSILKCNAKIIMTLSDARSVADPFCDAESFLVVANGLFAAPFELVDKTDVLIAVGDLRDIAIAPAVSRAF